MAYELSFTGVDDKSQSEHTDISLKITAIEAQIVKISEERANAEAIWRKKENYLNTEKGKLQLQLQAICAATLTEVAG